MEAMILKLLLHQTKKIYYIYKECKPLCEFKICDDIFMNDKIGKFIAIEENTQVGDIYDISDMDNGNPFYYNEILVSNYEFVGESILLLIMKLYKKYLKKYMVLNLFLNIKAFNFWFLTSSRISQ